MIKQILSFMFLFVTFPVFGATVVANVGGTPITDTDITARVAIMQKTGKNSADNRRVALQSIIDDHVKLNYAANFNVSPSDDDVDGELKRLKMNNLTESQRAMARNAMRADIAWQMVVARTIIPTIEVTDEEIAAERRDLSVVHGLPLEMTIVRLVDIPADVATKLTKPKSCDDAMKMATDLGGEPMKFTAMQYDLALDVRDRVADLPILTWSPVVDRSVLLVCKSTKTAEYGKLDDIIRQNALYKRAMFMADQQLKQLRRRAVVVINDDRYKL